MAEATSTTTHEPLHPLEEGCLMCLFLDELGRTVWGRHLLNARKEVLLAVRAMVDQRIERIERATQKSEAKRIEVQ